MNFETVLFYKQQQQQQTNEVGGTANRVQADASSSSRAGLVSGSEFFSQMYIT
jgi:hypothetical protein